MGERLRAGGIEAAAEGREALPSQQVSPRRSLSSCSRPAATYPATGISLCHFFERHGLITATPAALYGPVSRVATANPCAAAIAAM